MLLADVETDEILYDNGELKQKNEQEKQRAERLAAKLRELGISPESFWENLDKVFENLGISSRVRK